MIIRFAAIGLSITLWALSIYVEADETTVAAQMTTVGDMTVARREVCAS